MRTIGGGSLRIEDYSVDGRHTWVLSGRLERASASAFVATAAQLCAGGARGLAVDLGALSGVDSAGLAAVSAVRELYEEQGCQFSLAPLSRAHVLPEHRRVAHRGSAVAGFRVRHARAAEAVLASPRQGGEPASEPAVPAPALRGRPVPTPEPVAS